MAWISCDLVPMSIVAAQQSGMATVGHHGEGVGTPTPTEPLPMTWI